jgi:glycosyltransferase involved in cell wall biosynthesis
MKKRILIFSLVYYPTHVGGAEIAIKEITDRIDPKDIEFDMVCLQFDNNLPKVEKVGNVTVNRIGFTKDAPTMVDLRKFPLHLNKLWFQFAAAWKAYKLNKKNNYDAVWAMMAHSTGVPAGLFKTFNSKVPYTLTLQEGDPINYIKRKMLPLYPLFKRGFTKADIIQPISTFLASWARDMGFKGRIQIIPNAVNTAHFSQEYSDKELNELKKKLGKKEDEKYIITTSRLVHKNAVDDVIVALTYLPENVKFLVLGVGPDEEKLKALAKEKGVENRVMFIGQVDHSVMPKYLKISDVFTRPSRSEGFGNSFIEAMAARIPVVATPAGGIVDFLFDPDKTPDKEPTGLLAEIDNPKDLAKQLERALSDEELLADIIPRAQKMAREKYDWNLIAHDMETKVFDKVFK